MIVLLALSFVWSSAALISEHVHDVRSPFCADRIPAAGVALLMAGIGMVALLRLRSLLCAAAIFVVATVVGLSSLAAIDVLLQDAHPLNHGSRLGYWFPVALLSTGLAGFTVITSLVDKAAAGCQSPLLCVNAVVFFLVARALLVCDTVFQYSDVLHGDLAYLSMRWAYNSARWVDFQQHMLWTLALSASAVTTVIAQIAVSRRRGRHAAARPLLGALGAVIGFVALCDAVSASTVLISRVSVPASFGLPDPPWVEHAVWVMTLLEVAVAALAGCLIGQWMLRYIVSTSVGVRSHLARAACIAMSIAALFLLRATHWELGRALGPAGADNVFDLSRPRAALEKHRAWEAAQEHGDSSPGNAPGPRFDVVCDDEPGVSWFPGAAVRMRSDVPAGLAALLTMILAVRSRSRRGAERRLSPPLHTFRAFFVTAGTAVISILLLALES